MAKIETDFTRMMRCDLPLIGAPMFLVSNVDMVVAVSEAGGVGTFPALNYRPLAEYEKALKAIKVRTKKPTGVNIIVNKSNTRQNDDLKLALDAGIELFITSLGNPRQVIVDAHKNGAKVICDVINLEQALKVQDMGADGVIAVSAGAGGHAGPITPFVFVPWLKKKINIPVIAAGGIADGYSMAAALTLGASAVSVGTRFIACKEAQVDMAYKEAILKSSPEDIVMTTRVSGTPATVINTPYVQKMGLDLPWYLKFLKSKSLTKKYVVPLIHFLGMRQLEAAAAGPTWKTVWCAGQSVGLIDEILSSEQIVQKMIEEYRQAIENQPTVK